MRPNKSPWLHQLDKNRKVVRMQSDITTDVVIVGGGIAGIATAFFTLTRTTKKVVLLEGFKIAHGATGHNAGQITSYFERPFSELVAQFGIEKAGEGQKAIEDAWLLLNEIYTTADLDIDLSRFIGHAGLSSYEQIIEHLENNRLRVEAGLSKEIMRISHNASCLKDIPDHYKDFYIVVSHDEVLELLETRDKTFIASISFQKGCMNSALFVQEIVTYLLKTYTSRFFLYEYARVKKVILKITGALLDVDSYTVTAEQVVLCTNGFDRFTIVAPSGLDVNTRFHHDVRAVVGYMSGYLETFNKPPIAISYFADPHAGRHDTYSDDPYFYLTRRSFSEKEGGARRNLISIGGPETPLTDRLKYTRDMLYPDAVVKEIDGFVHKVYDTDPNKKIDYTFTWHGLMGYTTNGVRMIGPDPEYKQLLYNLGCNGVGILPSLHGGLRIAEYLSGKELKPSLFDIPIREE